MQGAVADHLDAGVPSALGGVHIEQVVLDVEHLGTAAADDAPADDTHGLLRRRLIEGGRAGRPPVDHQRLVVGVPQPQPSNVADLAVGEIQPSEDQALVLRVQCPQPHRRVVDHRVALHERSRRPRAGEPITLPMGPLGLLAQRRQPRVHAVDVALLLGDLRLTGHVGHVLACSLRYGPVCQAGSAIQLALARVRAPKAHPKSDPGPMW